MDPLAVRRALRETLEQQIVRGDPPETGATLKRLIKEGVGEEKAWRLLSLVLLDELNEIVGQQRPFDRARYVAALNALPNLPSQLGGV